MTPEAEKNNPAELLLEKIITRVQTRLKLFPDIDEMALYQRGLYDGYLNALKIIVECGGKKNIDDNPLNEI